VTFAKWVFTIGGIWGVLIIGPLFFAEGLMVDATGKAFNHPDTFYGFVGSTFAWQLGYLVIGRNPAPYRPFMLLGALGKFIYFGATWTLFAQGRIPITVPMLASPDLLLAILFVVAWFRTKPAPIASAA
jgi:hypothetical protein